MAFEVDGVEIFEWPWPAGGGTIAVETMTGLWDPATMPVPAKVADSVGMAIYGPGLAEGSVIGDTDVKPGVDEVVASQVTELDSQMIVHGVTSFMADELWLPGEKEDVANWQSNGLFQPDKDIKMGQADMMSWAALGSGIWQVIGPFVIGLMADTAMEWLSDKLGGVDAKAIYYRGKLIGQVVDGELRGTGLQGL